MKRVWIRYLLPPLLAAALLPTMLAAARIGPPAETLRKEPNLIAAVTAREKLDDAERVVFEVRELLHGKDVPERVTVRLDEEAYGLTEEGQSYLLGFAVLRKVARRHGLFETDPRGPYAVRLAGVGDALLEDSTALRLLLDPATEPGRALAAIWEQLGRSDVLSSRFAAAELLFRSDLAEHVSSEDLGTFRSLLDAEDMDEVTRELLFEAAGPVAARLGGGWLAEACRRQLRRPSSRLDLSSPISALLVTAARVLGEVGASLDLPLLATHLRSNNPGVAKAAFKAMTELDRAGALKLAVAALDEDVHPETRRTLEAHLERSD